MGSESGGAAFEVLTAAISEQVTDELSILRVSQLEQGVPAEFTATWSGIQRRLNVVYDRVAPRRFITRLTSNATAVTFVFQVGERVVPFQDSTCDAGLQNLSPAVNIIDVLAASEACNRDFTKSPVDSVFIVEGVDNSVVTLDPISGSFTVVTFPVGETTISLALDNGAIMDFAGNRNPRGTQAVSRTFRPPKQASSANDTAADNVGRAATVMVATTVAASAATSIGMVSMSGSGELFACSDTLYLCCCDRL